MQISCLKMMINSSCRAWNNRCRALGWSEPLFQIIIPRPLSLSSSNFWLPLRKSRQMGVQRAREFTLIEAPIAQLWPQPRQGWSKGGQRRSSCLNCSFKTLQPSLTKTKRLQTRLKRVANANRVPGYRIFLCRLADKRIIIIIRSLMSLSKSST